ncbi:hypothetical protein E2542_SST11855 [Spatholobus suberectus]|nr:hypothetical protein E2542_SST11855 [Spatholobus suberectus]
MVRTHNSTQWPNSIKLSEFNSQPIAVKLAKFKVIDLLLQPIGSRLRAYARRKRGATCLVLLVDTATVANGAERKDRALEVMPERVYCSFWLIVPYAGVEIADWAGVLWA